MTVGRVADKADIVLPVATGQLAAVAIMLSSTVADKVVMQFQALTPGWRRRAAACW